MVILLGVIMFLSIRETVTSKQILDIPKKNEISFIEIYNDFSSNTSKLHTIEDAKDISEIYNTLLLVKKNKIIQSIDDSPTNINGKLIRIVLADSSNNLISLFVYQGNDGKYYIEKPYEGIYEISVQVYETFTKF